MKRRNYVNIYSTALQELQICFIIVNSYMDRCVFSFDLKISKDENPDF